MNDCLRPERIGRELPRTERSKSNCYRGLSVLISLNGPSASGSLFNDLCAVQRHRTKV
jgi:hypothetical protein